METREMVNDHIDEKPSAQINPLKRRRSSMLPEHMKAEHDDDHVGDANLITATGSGCCDAVKADTADTSEAPVVTTGTHVKATSEAVEEPAAKRDPSEDNEQQAEDAEEVRAPEASTSDQPKLKKRRKPTPKPGLWRSTHIAPHNLLSGQPKEASALRETVVEHGIRIPYDGWFGLCFGLELNDDIIKDGDYSIYLVYPNDDTTKRISLPLKHKNPPQKGKAKSTDDDNGDETYDRLTNINVGKLFYLTRGSIVLVVRNGALLSEAGGANNDSKKAQMKLAQQQQFLLKWCLIAAHHNRGKVLKNRSNNQQERQQNNATKNEDMLKLQQTKSRVGAMNATHVVCATCVRTFRSVQAVLCHSRSQHHHCQLPPGPMKSTKSTSIWNTPLKVIFQDSSMAIVVKPQGMAVQGGSPSLLRSNLLMALKDEPTKQDAENHASIPDDDRPLSKPIPCHRLDSPTGGLLVVAKTKNAERSLKLAFAEKKCQKRYRALLVGKVEPKVGEITEKIGGKDSYTKYEVVRYSRSSDKMMAAASTSDGWITVVDLYPITGRRHQLRKHTKALGHPIWGDVRYGHYINHPIASPLADTTDPNKNPHARLCLWAMEITLPHPVTGEEMTFKMDDPIWLSQVLNTQGTAYAKHQFEDR